MRFLTCFSVVRNTSKIMDCNVPPSAITSINGVRVLSMWWVILGHTYLWLLIFRTLSKCELSNNMVFFFILVPDHAFLEREAKLV